MRSDEVADWLLKLTDGVAVAKITARIDRLCRGNPGDVKRVGGGVNQLQIEYGPGYRVYYAEQIDQIIVLLADGTQEAKAADIVKSKSLLKELKAKMATAKYDTADFLQSSKAIQAYMDEALDTKDAAFVAYALAVVVRAKQKRRELSNNH